MNWIGLGTSIFSSQGQAIAWNGTRWVAGGSVTNSFAYSSDGIIWTGIGVNTIQSVQGLAWSGIRWVAVGQQTTGTANTIAYSSDGISWTGVCVSIFPGVGQAVAWNGIRFVAAGVGGNHTLAYSNDGITWVGLGKTIFPQTARGIAWNGVRWIAVGDTNVDTGTTANTIAISTDGINWGGLGLPVFFRIGTGTRRGRGVASNPSIGATIVDSQITLNSNMYPQTNRLEIVSDRYYNNGYLNFSVDINGNILNQ